MALVKTLLNGNEVEYDDTEFEIYKEDSISYLHYIGNGGAVNNPKGNTSCYKMFNKCRNIEVLDVSHFDTSNVTSMEYMFGYCESLTKLDVSHFDTSNVTTMCGMFYFCLFLTELDVSNFDTSNVVDTSLMFGCHRLTGLDVSNFDTSKVTNMRHMFGLCERLTELNLSNFDTSKVVEMENMFDSCKSLIELDLSNFDTSKVTDMRHMFFGCESLTKLDVSNFDTSKVSNMGSMFEGCKSLSTLDLSSFDTSNVTNMYRMFLACKSLKKVDLSNFDTSSVTSMENMFEGCMSLKELDLSHFKMSQVEASSMFNIPKRSSMFKDCQSLISLNLSGFDTVISSMFDGCTSLSSLDLSNLSKLYLVPMFLKCNNLENIVFKRLDILSYSVEDLKFIFEGCPYLDKLLAMKKQRPINRSGSSTSNPAVGAASGILMPSEAYMGIDDLFLDLLEDLKTADERDTLKKLRNKGIKDSDFVGILSVAKPDSEMINTYCDRVIIPAIKDLFKLNKDGRSSLTVGDVFKKIAAQHGNGLAAIALVRFLSDEYLVE